MADDFAALEPWLGQYLATLSPAEVRRFGLRIGGKLRQANARRISANVEPDGSKMEPRKSKLDRRGKVIRREGDPMFRKLRLARNMTVRGWSDRVVVSFNGRADRIARVHHFGLTDSVDAALPDAPRVKYPPRRLLGLSDADRAMIEEEVLRWLAG